MSTGTRKVGLLSAYLLVLVVLAANIVLTSSNLLAVADSSRRVDHTRRVATEIHRILDTLTTAESGQRGYLLTGKDADLGYYRSAAADLDGELDRLASLTAEDLRQQGRIAELRRLAADKKAELERTIALRHETGMDAAVKVVLGNQGRQVMDRARRVLADMEGEEDRLLAERDAAFRIAHQRAITTFLVVSAITLLLLLLGFLIQGRDKAIGKSESWLSTTLTSIGDAVIATDDTGRVRILNPIAESLTGWTQAEAVGRPIEDVFQILNEETRQPVENPTARVIREGVIVGLANHTVVIARDGTETAIEDSAAPVRDQAGNLTGVVMVFQDATERRRYERALTESERRFRGTFEQAAVGMAHVGHDGRWLSVNDKLCGIVGYDRDELLARTFQDITHPDDLDADLEQVRRLIAGDITTYSMEKRYLHKDGPIVWVNITVSMVRDAEESFGDFICVVEDITGRKQIEEELWRHMEELAVAHSRLETVFGVVDEGIVVFDPQGHVVLCNEAEARICGYSTAEEMRRDLDYFTEVFELCDPDGHPIPVDQWPVSRVLKGETVRDWEAHGRRRDTGQAWEFRFSGSPVMAVDGRQLLSVIVTRDITQQKRAEEVRLDALRLKQVITDNATTGIIMQDGTGRCTFMNPAAEQMTGFTFEEMNGRNVHDTIHHSHPDGRPFPMSECEVGKAVHAMKWIRRHEDLFVRKDGTFFPVVCNASPVQQGGVLTQVVLEFRDITEEKRAAEALRQSEERFRTLADNIPQLCWMARPDGHIDWYNKRWHDYTGTTPEQMQGWGWQGVHDPEVLPLVMERWKGSIASGEPFDMVFPLRRADGHFRPFLTRVMPVRGDDGQVIHWFGTNTDISDRLEVEGALRAAKEEAEHANRAKDQFLAVLSHELRTPLNPILLAVSAMLDRPPEPGELRPSLEMIRQNVTLQARLIDDLLDVMRIVRGKMPLHWEVANAHALVRHALDICRSELNGKRLSPVLDLAAYDHCLNADPARLQQVLWNLIKNAVKFTPQGGTVTIRTRNENGGDTLGDRLVIEVADTGIGIGPEILPRIFDPFQQGETTITRRFGGLGLGLAICKGIIEAHGGTIAAESGGEHQGTLFRIVLRTLPASEGECDGSSGNGHISRPVETPRSPHLKLLLVEDDPTTVRLLARLLRSQGHEVTTAVTVADAIGSIQSIAFDMILSDIGLPDGTGLDLMRRIVTLRGPVPSIALTGFGMEEDIERSRAAGFTVHMTKPIDFARLEAMIRQVTT